MSVIYRKYRPQSFKEIVGQEHIIVTLENEIIHDKLAHAYLFVGPRGTGKTTIARLLARAVNCTNKKNASFEPCGKCTSCKNILSERNLDVIEIDAATHTGVDDVRDVIISSAHVPPINPDGYKVFIIDEVHMLSKHAFNALLKTIEEPPTRVLFLLATTEIYKVPETIISRCERFDLRLIPQSLIEKRIEDISRKEKISIPNEITVSISKHARGSMRDAESLLGQILGLSSKGKIDSKTAEQIVPLPYWENANALLSEMRANNVKEALILINNAADTGVDMSQLRLDVTEYIRMILLKKVIGSKYFSPVDDATKKHIDSHSESFSIDELNKLIIIFSRLSTFAKTTSIEQLPLELAVVTFCKSENIAATSSKSPTIKKVEQKHSKNKIKSVSDESILTTLRKEWTPLIESLKEHNHSLSIFLKVAHPISYENKTIKIGFKYDFHADTVNDPRNRKKVESTIADIVGQPVIIDCVVDSDYTDNHKNFNGSNETEVKEIIDILGGGELV